jgi:hypothetical protein
MTEDITDFLRESAAALVNSDLAPLGQICTAGANEIEMLRADLRTV